MEARFVDVWGGLRSVRLRLLLPGTLVPSPVGAISGHGVFSLFPLQDHAALLTQQRFCLGL